MYRGGKPEHHIHSHSNITSIYLIVEVYQYIGSAKYRLPIWQNFQYWQLVFFEIVLIFIPIFYISTNWLILLMHCTCLVVTIFTVLIITL